MKWLKLLSVFCAAMAIFCAYAMLTYPPDQFLKLFFSGMAFGLNAYTFYLQSKW